MIEFLARTVGRRLLTSRELPYRTLFLFYSTPLYLEPQQGRCDEGEAVSTKDRKMCEKDFAKDRWAQKLIF
jgi:hypothetical protein